MAFKQRSKGKVFKMMGSSPYNSGTHTEMKSHGESKRKHAHADLALPNNPDGKRKNPDIEPITTPDIKLMSKVEKN